MALAASPARGTRFALAWIPLSALLLLTIVIAYVCVPRQADLRIFDPVAMARSETALWRDYYDKRYAGMFLELYRVARDQNGFSPLDSFRIALAAARAAAAFQPTQSRDAAAAAALPQLRNYFTLLAKAAPVPVDVEAAARAEFDWWQARREAASPEQYGLAIARVSSLLYGVDDHRIRSAGVVRARAMAYRDARAGAMRDADWVTISGKLAAAYDALKWGALRRP